MRARRAERVESCSGIPLSFVYTKPKAEVLCSRRSDQRATPPEGFGTQIESSNMSKYTLHDTFNDRLISSHRTLEAAVKAQRKFSAAVRRANGGNSYIPTTILINGNELNWDQQEEMFALLHKLDTAR